MCDLDILPVPKAGACIDELVPIWNPIACPCPCAGAGADPPNMKGADVSPCDDDCKGGERGGNQINSSHSIGCVERVGML